MKRPVNAPVNAPSRCTSLETAACEDSPCSSRRLWCWQRPSIYRRASIEDSPCNSLSGGEGSAREEEWSWMKNAKVSVESEAVWRSQEWRGRKESSRTKWSAANIAADRHRRVIKILFSVNWKKESLLESLLDSLA